MSDIKKFTGFIAPDGSTHSTMKKASAYTFDLKVKAALGEFANIQAELNPGVEETTGGLTVVHAADMPEFLFSHRDAILSAFKPEITTRKKRVAKAPGALKVAKAAIAKDADVATVVESPVMGVAVHDGVLNLDE